MSSGGAFRVAAGGDTGVGTGTAGFGVALPIEEALELAGNFDGALTTEHAWRATTYLGLTYSFYPRFLKLPLPPLPNSPSPLAGEGRGEGASSLRTKAPTRSGRVTRAPTSSMPPLLLHAEAAPAPAKN